MSILLILVIILGVLIPLLAGLIVILRVDWRAFFVRRYGQDYTKGLAHVKIGETWCYRESKLLFEGDDAMTYSRPDDKADDIVPNEIGYEYDEYTGRRVYRVRPGADVACSDSGEAVIPNYPPELISCHVMGRTVCNLATSVNAENSISWKPIIIGAILLIIVVGGLVLMMGRQIKSPIPTTGTEKPPVTAPAQSGPVEGNK